jgi:chromosome segregation ATPase
MTHSDSQNHASPKPKNETSSKLLKETRRSRASKATFIRISTIKVIGRPVRPSLVRPGDSSTHRRRTRQMIDWENATLQQRIDQLRNQLAGFLVQMQELQSAVGQLEKRVNALENRPAVGS